MITVPALCQYLLVKIKEISETSCSGGPADKKITKESVKVHQSTETQDVNEAGELKQIKDFSDLIRYNAVVGQSQNTTNIPIAEISQCVTGNLSFCNEQAEIEARATYFGEIGVSMAELMRRVTALEDNKSRVAELTARVAFLEGCASMVHFDDRRLQCDCRKTEKKFRDELRAIAKRYDRSKNRLKATEKRYRKEIERLKMFYGKIKTKREMLEKRYDWTVEHLPTTAERESVTRKRSDEPGHETQTESRAWWTSSPASRIPDPVRSSGPAPPPPPPPPSPKSPKSHSVADSGAHPVRTPITVDMLKSVKLRPAGERRQKIEFFPPDLPVSKTPPTLKLHADAVDGEHPVQIPMTVDMLKSVKLRPAGKMRQGIEWSANSPTRQ